MADSIKIGNLDISAFKVGSSDCRIYLGDILLYPQSQPIVKDYFRFIAREDGTFKLSGNSLSYSLDSGTTWTSLASDTYSPTVASGSSIMFKATSLTVNNGIGKFISSGDFDVEGNIMSLIYGDDFETATTITNVGQFRSIFDSNSNVINASGLTLPATTISQDAYRSMFYNCSNLVTAPELPATTLAQSCYANMFQGCTSLTTAPILSATTLPPQCYANMFYGCTSLNYIKCLATNINAADCTIGWVYGVAASGTFIRAEGMRSWSRGASGIPSGWLALPSYNFAITSLADNNTITLSNNSKLASATTFSYSLDNGVTWTDFYLTSGQTATIATINSGDTIHLKGSNDRLGTSYNYGHYFRGSGDYEISGEISSLINGNDYDTELTGTSMYKFAQLFSGDTHLVSAENLRVSSTALPSNCFNSTFRDCTRLTSAPELPSIRLGDSCYSSMFEGCIALSKVPSEISFIDVGGSQVFQRMFCMSRTSKVTTPAMTESPKLFGNWDRTPPTNKQMFCGNGNLTKIYCYWTRDSGSFLMTNWVNYTADSGVTFYKRSIARFASGANGIKTGWTVVNDDSTT